MCYIPREGFGAIGNGKVVKNCGEEVPRNMMAPHPYYSQALVKEINDRASEMAQQVRVLAAKPGHLSFYDLWDLHGGR